MARDERLLEEPLAGRAVQTPHVRAARRGPGRVVGRRAADQHVAIRRETQPERRDAGRPRDELLLLERLRAGAR
jgi:hypothetical protein